MYWFKKMINAPTFLSGSKMTIGSNGGDFCQNEFYSMVSDAKSFVLTGLPKNTNISGRFSEIDLPFKVCSFELLDGDLSMYFKKSNTLIVNKCLLVGEVSPRVYRIYALVENENTLKLSWWTESVGYSGGCSELIQSSFLEGIKNGNIVCENIKESVKIGYGQNRRRHVIRQIIHIRPKKELQSDVKPIYGGKLDFTHRFEVRGHWRKICGLGKDRDGNYSVHNMTWVVPHEKGPEHLPLIKKTRIIDTHNEVSFG